MTRRGALALLLMAGLIGMHGLVAPDAPDAPGAGAIASRHSAVDSMPSAPVHDGTVGDPQPADPMHPTGHDGAHDPLCVAVLVSLAALLIALIAGGLARRRLRPRSPRAAPSPRARPVSSPRRHPPSISLIRLCLLRI